MSTLQPCVVSIAPKMGDLLNNLEFFPSPVVKKFSILSDWLGSVLLDAFSAGK